MTTDYVLFIHGVNTRERREERTYAKQLISLIKKALPDSYNIEPLPLYWGDVNKQSEDELLVKLQAEKGCWEHLWFQRLRETTILQFIGDSVLYISRTVGSRIVEELNQQMIAAGLDEDHSRDRLHLVTHSWGTVILFDILFAVRWNSETTPGHKSAMAIRNRFYGVEPNSEQGIRLASIHTLGSPIALFSLLDVVQGEDKARGVRELTPTVAAKRASHDITPKLEGLLASVGKKLNGAKIPWCNYIHPGDPIAFPLDPLLFSLVDGFSNYVDLKDIITKLNWWDKLMLPFTQHPVSLFRAGHAHGSYLNSTEVAHLIAECIELAARPAACVNV